MKFTNELDLPQPFVAAASSEYTYTPKRYSVTGIIKGTCQSILERRHADEITVDVADQVWLIFGSAVHKVLEESQEGDTQIKEGKLDMDVPGAPGYKLSGIFDLYDDDTGIVTDYKTASIWKVQYHDWDDYRKQLLYYIVILRANGFNNAKAGEIVALLKDHSQTKAEVDPFYPQHPVYTIGWDFSEAEIEAARAEIMDRFQQIMLQESLPDEELEPCTESERWAKAPKYAVMKEGRKSAIKLYDKKYEAQDAACDLNDAGKGKHYVEYRPGESTRCKKYCNCQKWCKFYREEVANG